MAAKKMITPNKSCEKRIRQAEKANAVNRSTRSAIRTSLSIVRKAKTTEEALKEVPHLYSILDKSAAKGKAGFSKNRAANYKSKVGLLLNKLAVAPAVA
ncbi:hypothetical protein AGMMS49938_06290 [Fibrobacterales bacterium]|nr:hypothetical protein AGMMS49938_06290 [Fibrobacterales bacterium]